MRIALIPDVRYFLFTVQLFLKKLPTVVIRSVVRKDQTCTSSQRDLEKIHCVAALLESGIYFCNGRANKH